MKLKDILFESEENRGLTPEVKKHFLEIISTYNTYQEQMGRKSDIIKVAETLGGITEAARELALRESDDWFDKHTVKRNMSELDKLGKQFDKVANEAKSLDQRMTGLYEDMGNVLSRYYKIGEVTEDEMKERLGLKESKEELKHIKDLSKAMRDNVNEAKGKFKKDDLVYNKRTKTVGIVRMGDDKYGEVKTDADGNVNVDELEKYNPIKNKHQSNAKVAPSTEKEVNKRGLFNPFKNESKEDCGCGCGGVTEGGCGDSKLEEEQVAVATRHSSGNITTRIKEGMFGAIDQIRQDSKDVRDFVKNVFKDNEFKKMSNDKDFIKYLKSIYEGTTTNEAAPKMKKNPNVKAIQNISTQTSRLQKGGSQSRYSREFESARKRALKALGDMETYSKIGV